MAAVSMVNDLPLDDVATGLTDVADLGEALLTSALAVSTVNELVAGFFVGEPLGVLTAEPGLQAFCWQYTLPPMNRACSGPLEID